CSTTLQYSEPRNIRLPCVKTFLGIRCVVEREKMDGLLHDCRHAIRLYARTPRAAAVPVLMLAVGIGFAAAFLSLYVDLVLRPHPGFERSRGMATLELVSGSVMSSVPYGIVERMTAEMTSIDAVVMSVPRTVAVDGEPEPPMAEMV